MKSKSNPTSLRFDQNDLLLAKNKSGIKTTQKLVDFLLSEYVREFKPKFVSTPEDYVEIKNIITSGIKVKDTPKPTPVLKPQEQPKTNYSVSTIPEQKEAPTSAQALENIEIERLIAEIKAEKIPELRNKSDLGRKSWKMEQEKRIQELKNQLK